ncbi:putative AAA-ATPase [Clostridium tepidiprofundi DSM 19306]|uniref:Putative AAA-ATPase n=1 Tax=Clostridium tepidiprofundi DSM 19306 TaxID=1121338 RepID=A0A151B6Z9_9CLOT|nr:AAA family ATPase [Clostridium tepidiprofundi]KYH35573.1 putative AAA-ATPase [Clostridium tepidiprofundi DSM 19306]
MKKIPYGISDYKILVEKNYVFIDKTRYIEKLENYHAPYIFFLRPRRFGKSLFTSVLSNYYDIKEKDNFEKLYGNTYIGKRPTKEKNSYCILRFNFSGLRTDTKESLEESFTLAIRKGLDEFIRNYNIKVDYVKDTFVSSMFDSFLSNVKYEIDKPIYVIIDEYDHFANELLSFKPELFSDSISKTGFVRKWYEVLKIGTETIIQRIFATGVSPIALDSMTSGFNIGKNLTREANFNEMMGFTEYEVRELIKKTVNIKLNDKDMQELIYILKRNYNGYLFSEDASTRLFNSDMILYYLQEFIENGKGPKNLIDENIASDYSKIGNLFNLKSKDGNINIMNRILKGEELSGEVTKQFSLEKDFTSEDFLSIMFYLGFLTIKESELADVIYKIPNEAVKGIYFDYFAKKIREDSDYEIDISEIKRSVKNLALKGEIDSFIDVIERTLNKLSNRDFILFDEKYVKIIMIAYLNLAKAYLIKSEYEVEEGYIDIALLKRDNIEPKYFGIIELKYISQKKYEERGKAIIEKERVEAIKQINRYKKSAELSTLPNLKKWVLVFVKDKCVINEEVK